MSEAVRVVDTYAIQLIDDECAAPHSHGEMLHIVANALLEAKENINDLLPAGYSIRITRWNEETTTDE